jgi:hypothetical protein
LMALEQQHTHPPLFSDIGRSLGASEGILG